jgi:hypothetical protein
LPFHSEISILLAGTDFALYNRQKELKMKNKILKHLIIVLMLGTILGLSIIKNDVYCLSQVFTPSVVYADTVGGPKPLPPPPPIE